MWIHMQRHRGRRLLVAAAASASSLVLFGIAANPALASYKAQVQNGVLQITGDGASDKLALLPNGTALAVLVLLQSAARPFSTSTYDGSVTSEFCYTIGMSRFEAGELNDYASHIRRVPNDAPVRT